MNAEAQRRLMQPVVFEVNYRLASIFMATRDVTEPFMHQGYADITEVRPVDPTHAAIVAEIKDRRSHDTD
jgi:hypothetical protein